MIAVLAALFFHPGALPNPVPVNDAIRFKLYIPGETASPTVEVDVTTPPSFTPRTATGPGWEARIDANSIVLTGGSIPSGGLATFDIELDPGPGPPAGSITLPVVMKAADGTTLNWVDPIGGPFPALVIQLAPPPRRNLLPWVIAPALVAIALAGGLLLRRQLMRRSLSRQ